MVTPTRACVCVWVDRASAIFTLFSGFRGAPELVRVLDRVGFRGAPELVRVLDRAGFCVACGAAHKNVGDCRTSFLGTRSKGTARCTKALVDEELQVLILENRSVGSGYQRQNALLIIRLAWFCTLQHDSAWYSAGYGPKLDPSLGMLIS